MEVYTLKMVWCRVFFFSFIVSVVMPKQDLVYPCLTHAHGFGFQIVIFRGL